MQTPKNQIALTFGGNDERAPHAATMSSLEISEVTGSRHDSVKRTIERLAESGVITLPPTVEKPSTGGRPSTEFVFAGDKGRRDSIIVVAQLCPEYTAHIVDRWQELEAQVAAPAFAVPTTFSQALLLAAKQAEQIEQQQAALALVTPKAQALDRIAQAEGEHCISNTAKSLQMPPRKLFSWMEANRWIFRRGDKWIAYQERIESGYLTHRVTTIPRKNGPDREVTSVMVTAKGQAKLALVAVDL